jgi:hypothetical protein
MSKSTGKIRLSVPIRETSVPVSFAHMPLPVTDSLRHRDWFHMKLPVSDYSPDKHMLLYRGLRRQSNVLWSDRLWQFATSFSPHRDVIFRYSVCQFSIYKKRVLWWPPVPFRALTVRQQNIEYYQHNIPNICFILSISCISVGSLCYKPESRGFETRWGHSNFSIYLILPEPR